MASGDAADDVRFLHVSSDDTSRFIDEMKNNNTKMKTKNYMKILSEWLHGDNELRAVDQNLARFFLSVRSKKNEEYESDSLKAIQSSVSRYLMEKNGTNILQDKEFHHCREVLTAKRKLLKSQGLGNKRRKADPFSSDDIDLLFQKKLLGTGKFLKIFSQKYFILK